MDAMKILTKTIVFSVVILLTALPAFACLEPPPEVDDCLPPISDPVSISLFNSPEVGQTDTISLFALNLFDNDPIYDLQFNQAGGGDWQSFNPLLGPIMGDRLNLTTVTFDQPGIIDLNLRLTDGDDVVSDRAEVNFYSFQTQLDDYNWYNWVELRWLDDCGDPLDVTSALTAWLPWDSQDLVGTAVPIPGTALLLSLGVLCLVGRRNCQR
jgi:hypothetical protein